MNQLRTSAERVDSAVRAIRRSLEAYRDAGNKAALKLAQQISESQHPSISLLDKLAWMDARELYMAKLAARALAHLDDPKILEGRSPAERMLRVVEAVVQESRDALLHNYVTGNSTNPYSNAVDGDKRAAMSKFYEQFEPYCAELRNQMEPL